MKKKKAARPFTALYRQSACQANQLAADIYSAADTPFSRSLLSSLSGGDYATIVSASVSPMDYTNADTFSRDYLCAELMSKYPHWEIGINRSAVALQKFWEVEEFLQTLNFTSNSTLVVGQKSTTMRAVETTARRKNGTILGDFSWDEAHSFFAFGPGASTSMSRRRGDAAYKFGALRPHLSYNAESLAGALFNAHPTWDFQPQVVAGSKLVTVPKNAKTDRSICIEPDLNMYFQKGIGKVIRRRLQRWGLLKPTAQQYNAELARQGSANGRLATIDLSSASDSVSMEIVRLLLPPDWVSALELARSPFTVLPSGEVKLLRKISSMGNGFTFELETLIFYALCSAVIDLLSSKEMDRQCTVFGDDIIISSDLVPVLTEVLSFFGFVVNPKKSFSTGPFRESCGKHYFAGIDVTPFYVRDRIDSVPRKYWAANSVKRYSRLHWGLDSRYLPVYNGIIDSIPPFFRKFKIPEGVGDGGIVSDWDDVRPSPDDRALGRWRYEDVIPRFKRQRLGDHGTLLKVLHQLEYSASSKDDYPGFSDIHLAENQTVSTMSLLAFQKFCSEGLIDGNDFMLQVLEMEPSVLNKPQGFKRHEGFVSQWPSFGPWI